MKALSFSGHRPNKLGGYTGKKANEIQGGLLITIKEIICRAVRNGFDTIISGGAVGVDQIVMQATIELKVKGVGIKLIVARPFPAQHSKWPKHIQERFLTMLDEADEVVDVCDGEYAIEKMHIRNKWMVNKSAATCAIWNGGYGGTKHCIEYCRRVNQL